MDGSGECMSNDVTLPALGGGSHASGLTLRSYQVWGVRGHD